MVPRDALLSTEHSNKHYPYHESSCAFYDVSEDESFVTQITVKCILESLNLHMALQVVSEDEFLVTQTTGIWIVPIMICHVWFQEMNYYPQYDFS